MTDPHDSDSIGFLAKMAETDVQRALGSDAFVPLSSVSRVLVQLAERVDALTVEVRRLKGRHDVQAEDGLNGYGTVRGVCSCGWITDYEEPQEVSGWIARHRALYSETAS